LIAIVCFATAPLLLSQPGVAQTSSGEKSAAAAAQRTLSLTSAEQAEIWRHLSKLAGKTSIPAGLHVGEVIPDTMHSRSFAREVRKKVPAIRSYSYALTHDHVLIIDPRSKKIVFIVAP
jgi:hypothetical protein